MPPLNDSDSSQNFDTPVVISKRFLVVVGILFVGVCASRAAQLAWLADGRRRVDLIRFGRDLSAKIWIYSDAVMDRLRDDRNVDFIAIEDVLAQAEREIAEASYANAREILDFLERYYFRTAGSQRQAVAKRLRALVASRRE